MWIKYAFCLVSLAGVCACDSAVTYNQRGRDDILYQQIIATLPTYSAAYCGYLCRTTPGCFGFDYKQADGMCVLHDAAAITLSTPQAINAGSELVQNFGFPDMFCSPSIGSCVFHVTAPMTWSAARDHCIGMGMDLQIIGTTAELNFVNDVRLFYGVTAGAYWTGGNDVGGSFVWAKTGALMSSTENLWYPGEPSRGIEKCVAWYTTHKKFNDYPCTSSYPFTCEP